MSLGGDFERLLGMLKRSNASITLDTLDLTWIEVCGVRFVFDRLGHKLLEVRKITPQNTA